MVWLIIIGVLALAIGPILYTLPSAQDRYLAGLRQQARQLGFTLQLRRLNKLDPKAEERVSASGQQLDSVVDCMCYDWLIRQPLKDPPNLLLQRMPEQPTVPVQVLFSGWGFAKLSERNEVDQAALLVLARHPQFQSRLLDWADALPRSVLAVGLNATTINLFWKESAAADRQLDPSVRVQTATAQLQSLHQQVTKLAADLVAHFGTGETT